MALELYNKKRDFQKTAEPKGKVVKGKKNHALKFVVQKHAASHLHYDFRLEIDGVLVSWAVPKGPSLVTSDKRLAAHVEDHPLDYVDFEGIIPEGEYGGGTVMLWDTGTYEPIGDPAAGVKAGKLHVVLHGEKLKGEFALVMMHGRFGQGGKNWLLFKVQDNFAKAKYIDGDNAKSVKTGRTMEQIAEQADATWKSNRSEKTTTKSKPAAKAKSSLPGMIEPQLATLVDKPPAGDNWLHEIKFDGYRLLAFVRNGRVELQTRNHHDWTDKFEAIADGLAKLKVENAIIDGEAVVLDKTGKSDFQSLQAVMKDDEPGTPIFYAFDLLYLDGEDLRELPLIKRKETLDKLLGSIKSNAVAFSDHVVGKGDGVLAKACKLNLEGIICKKADSKYSPRRTSDWQKVKCEQRQEFVVVGYTHPQGSRTGFGALLVAVNDEHGVLHYAGRVGTGFNESTLKTLFKQLSALETDMPENLANAPSGAEKRESVWVKPKLVAEVRFTEWTRDNHLRHPTFMGLRSDKSPKDIVREVVKSNVRSTAKSATTPGAEAPDPSGKVARTERKKSGAAAPGVKEPTSDEPGEVAGVKLTHPDKVLYPDVGITKQDVADYYANVAKLLLPHVLNRPLAIIRCPGGHKAKCFFQRNYGDTLPEQVKPADVSVGKEHEIHMQVTDLAGVISLVQMGTLEIHTWGCRSDDVEHPDQLIFDLDPGPGVEWKQVITGARQIRKELDRLMLPSFLKTSGGKGLHIVIPIERTISWDEAKGFTGTLAEHLSDAGDLFVANMRKDLRNGKIYLDYQRNGRGAMAVAPYSTRARDGAPVSMPISWEELGKLKSAAHFTVEKAAAVLERRKDDPWKRFEASRVDVRKAISSIG